MTGSASLSPCGAVNRCAVASPGTGRYRRGPRLPRAAMLQPAQLPRLLRVRSSVSEGSLALVQRPQLLAVIDVREDDRRTVLNVPQSVRFSFCSRVDVIMAHPLT